MFVLANDELWGAAIVVLMEQCLQMSFFPGILLVFNLPAQTLETFIISL